MFLPHPPPLQVGGRSVTYVQDPLAKKEQGEARRKRALEVFGDWCPQVRFTQVASCGLKAMQCGGWASVLTSMQPTALVPAAKTHMPASYASLADNAAACLGPALNATQVRSLIEGVDPLALTEHAQLHRLPEDCKVGPRWRLQLSQLQPTGCCV